LERTERWYEAEMQRIRAEILLKRDPADAAAAEQALQTAIAIAQHHAAGVVHRPACHLPRKSERSRHQTLRGILAQFGPMAPAPSPPARPPTPEERDPSRRPRSKSRRGR
jgi:hypothetical protein